MLVVAALVMEEMLAVTSDGGDYVKLRVMNNKSIKIRQVLWVLPILLYDLPYKFSTSKLLKCNIIVWGTEFDSQPFESAFDWYSSLISMEEHAQPAPSGLSDDFLGVKVIGCVVAKVLVVVAGLNTAVSQRTWYGMPPVYKKPNEKKEINWWICLPARCQRNQCTDTSSCTSLRHPDYELSLKVELKWAYILNALWQIQI